MREAAEHPTPNKPNNMKFQDLSIYDQSHADYNDHLNYLIRHRCSHSHIRPVYDSLFPYVQVTRKKLQWQLTSLMEIKERISNICTCNIEKRVGNFRKYMKDPENINIRKGFVSLLTLTGFHFGNRQNHLTKKMFFATVGALFGGWLCFPTETDEIVRDFSYKAVTNICKVLNRGTDTNFAGRPIMSRDLPKPDNNCPVCGRNIVETRECNTIMEVNVRGTESKKLVTRTSCTKN